jgi:hypothetical protein
MNDARRHKIYPCLGKRRPYFQRGGMRHIILQLGAHSRGYNLVERGSESQVSERLKRVPILGVKSKQ